MPRRPPHQWFRKKDPDIHIFESLRKKHEAGILTLDKLNRELPERRDRKAFREYLKHFQKDPRPYTHGHYRESVIDLKQGKGFIRILLPQITQHRQDFPEIALYLPQREYADYMEDFTHQGIFQREDSRKYVIRTSRYNVFIYLV